MTPITDTSLRLVYETVTTTIERGIAEFGEVPPALLAFDSDGACLGELIPSEILNDLQADEAGKQTLGMVLQALAASPKLPMSCMVQVSEAWAARYDRKEQQDVARAMLAAGVSVRDQRASRDVVMVALTTTAGVSMNCLDVDVVEGKRRVTVPKMMPRGSGKVEGKFAVNMVGGGEA